MKTIDDLIKFLKESGVFHESRALFTEIAGKHDECAAHISMHYVYDQVLEKAQQLKAYIENKNKLEK